MHFTACRYHPHSQLIDYKHPPLNVLSRLLHLPNRLIHYLCKTKQKICAIKENADLVVGIYLYYSYSCYGYLFNNEFIKYVFRTFDDFTKFARCILITSSYNLDLFNPI